MNPEINNIISLLQSSYEKGAWHGPSVKETLTQVSPENCFLRLPNSHSIIELVGHMTNWRNFVRKRMEGDLAFKVSDEENFPKATDWNDTFQKLERSQAELLAAIKTFPAERLTELVGSTVHTYPFFKMIHGVIHHDLYHTGQIILIIKNGKL